MFYKLNVSSNNFRKQGFGMIEVIVSIGIAAAMLVAFESLIVQSIKINGLNTKKFQANMYLREMIEVSKDLERSNWGELGNIACAAPSSCHPEISEGRWIFISGQESLDNGTYVRSLGIESASRDQLEFPNAIVTDGGIIDPNTKKIIATINWEANSQEYTSSLETYVYNNAP